MLRRLFFTLCTLGLPLLLGAAEPANVKVLYLTGHTDRHHSCEEMRSEIVPLLEGKESFEVTVVELADSTHTMKVRFRDFDVVVLNINEVWWERTIKRDFERYMRRGGGLVVLHEADNAFPEWEAFNRMTALGGWGGREKEAGPFFYWRDGKPYTDYTSEGSAGKHGKRVPFRIHNRCATHPIMRTLPTSWMHYEDELYGDLRGPAEGIEVLATAYSDASTGGTGKEEVPLFTVRYGKGRIFHCTLGHTKKGNRKALLNTEFRTLIVRGTEWAATGEVCD